MDEKKIVLSDSLIANRDKSKGVFFLADFHSAIWNSLLFFSYSYSILFFGPPRMFYSGFFLDYW